MLLNIQRRKFIKTAAVSTAGFSIIPRHVLGGKKFTAPSDTINLACVGVGGRGQSDINALSPHANVVAVCDVDWERASNSFNKFPYAKKYVDFRKMLEKQKDIDAVAIATPDHTHAVIAMTAMQMGKHVFLEKPLTKTVFEARELTKAAKKYNVVTQMGNQGHGEEGQRLVNEWIWAGLIGDVTEVHCFTDRPIWPQAINRPDKAMAKPATLDWDLWLGPVAYRPYHPAYAPFRWRGWKDFGVGAIGDMGAHIIDSAVWALDLHHPVKIQATSTPLNDETYPLACIITYTFPAKGNKPPITLKWYDGGLKPDRPEELRNGIGLELGTSSGTIFIGTKGKLIVGCYGRGPRLLPFERMKEVKFPAKSIPRSSGIHAEWIEAIKNGKKSSTDFSYSGPLTEMMLLGNIAVLMQNKNTILEWDSEKMEFTNLPEANDLLHYEYRSGWSL